MHIAVAKILLADDQAASARSCFTYETSQNTGLRDRSFRITGMTGLLICNTAQRSLK